MSSGAAAGCGDTCFYFGREPTVNVSHPTRVAPRTCIRRWRQGCADWRCRWRQGCRVHGRYRAAACTGAARSCPGSWSETARAASKPSVFGVIASFVYPPESSALCFVDEFFFFSVLDGIGQIREICTPQLIQTPQLHGLSSHGLHAPLDIRGSSSL